MDILLIMKKPRKTRPGLLLRMEPALLQKLKDLCDLTGIAYERFARRAVAEAIAREPMLSNGKVSFESANAAAIMKDKKKLNAKPAKPRGFARNKKQMA